MSETLDSAGPPPQRAEINAVRKALFPTLVRFDPVDAVHFKCYPSPLEPLPEDHRTVPNPSGIVPHPPAADWHAPHGRGVAG